MSELNECEFIGIEPEYPCGRHLTPESLSLQFKRLGKLKVTFQENNFYHESSLPDARVPSVPSSLRRGIPSSSLCESPEASPSSM